jgi:hypothetical protein
MNSLKLMTAIVITLAMPVAAQQNVPKSQPFTDIARSVTSPPAPAEAAKPDSRPAPPDKGGTFPDIAKAVAEGGAVYVPGDPVVAKATQELEVKRLQLAQKYLDTAFQYDLKVLELRDDAYRWHQLSSIIIFWVVIGMIVISVLLAVVQLIRRFDRTVVVTKPVVVGDDGSVTYASALEAQQAGGAAAAGGEQEVLKIGKEGLEIRTKIVGLLLLGFSMVFFYLYLATVYPIVESGSGATQDNVKSERK